MTDPDRRSPRPSTARERVNARRKAQGSGWRFFALGLGAAGLLLAAVLAVGLGRAGQTLGTIQQEDPRRRTSSVIGTATLEIPTALVAPSAAATPQPAGDPAGITPTSAPAPTAAATGSPAELPDPLRQPFSVLLVGVDKRADPEEGVRSDTLILVRVDPVKRTASMLSIPRDTVANIPNVGLAKINYAYSFGYTNAEALYGGGTDPGSAGQAVAAETVEQLLGVPVDYTAEVDFQGFERLVDSVGGVLVDVPAPLLDAEYPTENYGVERIYIAQGVQVMDGRTALIYARTRHASSDFDRGRRQQQVLRALLSQVRGRGLLENAAVLPRWADLLAENIRTTLPLSDLGTITGLASLARDLSPERVLQLSINPEDVGLDAEDGTDLYWNPVGLAALVARWQAGPEPAAAASGEPTAAAVADAPTPLPTMTPAPTPVAPAEDATVQVLNGAEVEGVAGLVTEHLRTRGFAMADPETVTPPYPNTVIIDYTGRPLTRDALVKLLGIAPQYVLAQPSPESPPQGFGVDIVVVLGADYRVEWTQP